jgi:hypothetical protein
MKKNDVFPSRFLKAGDLNGEPITLTIASAAYETLKNHKGNEEQKLLPGVRVHSVKAFRDKTRPVYDKWAGEIGIDLVRSAESIVESVK